MAALVVMSLLGCTLRSAAQQNPADTTALPDTPEAPAGETQNPLPPPAAEAAPPPAAAPVFDVRLGASPGSLAAPEGPHTAGLVRFGVVPWVTPAGRGDLSRPVVRLVRALTPRDAGARAVPGG